jgi:adenosylhomocysteine nucleosidase
VIEIVPRDVLLVFALASESQEKFNDFKIVHTGVGKINAAYGLTKALETWRHEHGKLPRMVINLGSAGSNEFNAGQVVNCTDFIQRDFDTTAVGEGQYETPNELGSACLNNGLPFDDFPTGICGTGDNFATEQGKFFWNVMDMEAYVYAKICRLEKVPFACFKYITDGADGKAADSFSQALVYAAAELRKAVDKIL